MVKKIRQFDQWLLVNNLTVHNLLGEKVTTVYKNYQAWAKQNSYKAVTLEIFKRQSLDFFPYIRTWQGIYRVNPKMI